MDLPIYCARGRTPHLAAYHVSAPGRQEVVCAEHLDASTAWAGATAQIHPVQQPAGAAPAEPAAQQQALF